MRTYLLLIVFSVLLAGASAAQTPSFPSENVEGVVLPSG
jgi:hypothetical protein